MLKKNSVIKIYRVEYFLLFLYLLVSIFLLLFSDGYIRYVLNISLIFLTFFILYFAPLNNKAILVIFSTLIYFSYLASSFIVENRVFDVSVFFSFYSYFLICYIILFSNNGRCYLNFMYKFFYGLVIIVFSMLLSGIDPGDIFSGSRNTVSQLLVPIGAIFLLDKRLEIKKISGSILYLMIFLSSVISFGRSGIITSILLLIALFFYFTTNINYRKLLMSIVFLVLLIFVLNYYYDSISKVSYFDYLRNSGIEDDYRAIMRNEYLSSLNIYNIFFGIDLSSLPYINSYNKNPHNAYLFLHSHLGFLILFTLTFVFLYWMRVLLLMELASFFAITAIILRLSTDSVSDITMLPIIFVCLMFFSKERNRKDKLTK